MRRLPGRTYAPPLRACYRWESLEYLANMIGSRGLEVCREPPEPKIRTAFRQALSANRDNSKPKQPGQNEIDGNEVVQNTRKHQDEQPEHDCERRAESGSRDDHGTLLSAD